MQWTLRSMFGVITGTAIVIGATRTLEIAIAIACILVLSAAWFAFMLITTKRRTKLTLALAVSLATFALYTGSFLGFRIFRTYEFSLAHPHDPNHNVVVFSMVPRVQQFACILYYPLIKLVPGHCVYPTRDQMEQLNSVPEYGEDPSNMSDRK